MLIFLIKLTMKNFLATIFLLLPFLVAESQILIPPGHFPGAVPVKGNFLYASETEVTNGQYLEFLNNLLKAGKLKEYAENLPDTSRWKVIYGQSDPMVEYYFRHPYFRDYPLVNITYKNALAYCNWLTEKINENLLKENSGISKVWVRLPTEKEWMEAARGKLDETAIYPWGTNVLWYNKGKWTGKFQANFARFREQYDARTMPLNTKTYWPNNSGLFNISGNVAEMVNEYGVTKGGSFISTAYYLRIDAREYYDSLNNASPATGFRYFIEVTELNREKAGKTSLKMNAKYIEKLLSKFNDSFYAGKYEVSNLLYRLFLDDLSRTNPVKYKSYKPDSSGWLAYFPYTIFNIYGWYPGYDNYPVVNISYEAAVDFMEWLTDKYNSLPGRKFKKVRFSLPTELEWESLAMGYNLTKLIDANEYCYPWRSPYLNNSRLKYLCNFNPQELRYQKKNEIGEIYYDYPVGDISVSRGLDGGIIPLPVNSYYSENSGLYNCAGNVAEMVLEKGMCKGGSWVSTEESLRIGWKEFYDHPLPTTGFRFVMKIIQK